MTHHVGIGMELEQPMDQLRERLSLHWCPGICRHILMIQASLVADADRVAVVPLYVCSDEIHRAHGVDHPILGDVVVVTTAPKSPPHVVADQLLRGVVVAVACGAAVDHQQMDRPPGAPDLLRPSHRTGSAVVLQRMRMRCQLVDHRWLYIDLCHDMGNKWFVKV